MGGIKPTNIFVITEESSDMTLFDCRWVPCSTRFVVAGTHTNGHGILRVYNSDSNKLEQLGKFRKVISTGFWDIQRSVLLIHRQGFGQLYSAGEFGNLFYFSKH